MQAIKNIWLNKKMLAVVAVVEMVLFLFLLLGFVKREESFVVFEGAVENSVEIELPKLEAGVYRVETQYQAAEGTMSVLEVVNKSGHYKSLYSDRVVLYGDENAGKTTFWLTEDSEELVITLAANEGADLVFEKVSFMSTNFDEAILLVGFLVIAVILNFGLGYGYHIKGRDDEKKCRLIAVLLVGLAIFVSIPLLTDYCLQGSELQIHLKRIEEMKKSLLEGRILNISLLIPALLRAVEMPVQTAYRMTLFLVNFVCVLSSYYCFDKLFRDKKIGLIGSMLYACMPYRLDAMYLRADYGETVAVSLLPLIFLGMFALMKEAYAASLGKWCWLWMGVVFAFIFQADITTFEVAMLMSLIMFILHCKKTTWQKNIVALVKIAIVFLALNLCSLIPLFEYMYIDKMWVNHVNLHSIQQGGLFMLHYFTVFWGYGDMRAYDGYGMQGAAPLGLGFVLTAILLFYLWVCFVGKYKEERSKNENWLSAKKMMLGGLVMVWMTTRYFPWDYLRAHSRLVQVATSDMKSPAVFMPAVACCFIFVSCVILKQVVEAERNYIATGMLIAVIGVTLITAQYLEGDILRNVTPMRIYAGETLEHTQIPSEGYLYAESGMK